MYRFVTALLSVVLLCAQICSSQAPHKEQQQIVAERLKKLGQAMFDYNNDDHFALPPAAVFDAKTGKPLLSWRVILLPYLGQTDLYKQFHLDEPWDSEHNKKLLAKMPEVFNHPSTQSSKKFETHYLLFVGPEKVPAGKKGDFQPAFRMTPSSKLTFREITEKDGISQTLFFAEAAKSVPWTKPEDLMIDHDEAPLPELGAMPGDVFVAALAEGKAVVLKKRTAKMTISKEQYDLLLRQLIGVNDGLHLDLTPIVVASDGSP